MKVIKTNTISYKLDKDLKDYTIGEVSDYCNSHRSCSDCVFKFLCKNDSGYEKDMVDTFDWKNSADKFQESKEFQLILEESYREDK